MYALANGTVGMYEFKNKAITRKWRVKSKHKVCAPSRRVRHSQCSLLTQRTLHLASRSVRSARSTSTETTSSRSSSVLLPLPKPPLFSCACF